MTPHARFEQLYTDEAADVLRYARYRVGPHLAEDIVAETFALAWQKLDRVPDPARPWLLATARRVSANQLRARRRRLAHELALSELDVAGPSATDDVDRRRDLLGAMRRLAPLDREAVLLVTWHDLSNGEAATVMDCSVTAFAVRLHRARRRLARLLEDADATLPTNDELEVLR